jgi:hypothetical protein
MSNKPLAPGVLDGPHHPQRGSVGKWVKRLLWLAAASAVLGFLAGFIYTGVRHVF